MSTTTIGNITLPTAELNAIITAETLSVGEDPNDMAGRAEFLAVYQADPDLLAEDLAKYRASLADNPPPFDTAPSEPTAEDYAAKAAENRRAEQDAEKAKMAAIEAAKAASKAKHAAAVSDIAGLIVAKYTDEGERNFAIGKRTLEHAMWQRDDYGDKYESGDVDNLMNRIRDEVRVEVAISPKAIKVGEWMRCYLLKLLVSKQIGDERADKLSFFEYRSVYGAALKFDKKNVDGCVVDGWMELVLNVVSARESGQRISSETFLKMVSDTEKRIAASKVTANPEAARLKVASDAIRADARAKNKANEDITTSISDAIAGNHMTPESVMGILETVVKHHGAEMPKSIGFDPTKCSTADCDTLARAMMASGKHAEMIRLRDNLNKCLAVMDKAAEKRLAIAV